MAKNVGLIGSISGKIGTIVFAVSNGIQTSRAYQPVVANPKSIGQNLQRAKGNLVGRLSSITPREAIVGLGVNNRARRSAFLRNGLIKATATLTDGVYSAKLQPSDVIFSKGSVLPLINVTSMSLTNIGVLTINYTRNTQVSLDEWTAAGGSWIIAAIDAVNGHYDFVRVFNWSKPGFPSSAADPLTESLAMEQVAGHELFVYFVPFVLKPELASTITGEIGIDAAAYVAELGLTEAASSLSYGNSKFIGEATQV